MKKQNANSIDKNNIPEIVKTVDEQLFQLVNNIDILDAIKPLNFVEQKELFFANQYTKSPEFAYQKCQTNGHLIKRELYNLPIENFDKDLYQLYLPIINSYVDKIDQFTSIGNEKFLYDSLRYYGEPSDKDIRNAQFILHLPDTNDRYEATIQNSQDICEAMSLFAEQHGYEYQQQLDESMIANALVSGTTVKVNSSVLLTKTDMNALVHHELGVHLVTTLNAKLQPLKILRIGCPLNTLTQEGLAILSESMSGYLTINRLKILALRVMAVQSMIKEKNFKNTFSMLKEDYLIDEHLAFNIAARVYRGGGFTKDYLYLKGFHLILNAYENETDFLHLLAGKTSLEYLPLINRLIEKNILSKPRFITPAYKSPIKNNAIAQFITHAIR